MILTPFLDLDQAYTTWLELRNIRYPWNESMDCWVEYVMSESWRHGDCHRHSMACGDGRRCRTAALVAIDAVLFWQEKHPAEPPPASLVTDASKVSDAAYEIELLRVLAPIIASNADTFEFDADDFEEWLDSHVGFPFTDCHNCGGDIETPRLWITHKCESALSAAQSNGGE